MVRCCLKFIHLTLAITLKKDPLTAKNLEKLGELSRHYMLSISGLMDKHDKTMDDSQGSDMNKQPKILYIDDEDDLLTLAASFFEDEALPIDTSTTFSDAVEKIKKGSYDLIISDARMPTGSGRELLNLIRKENIFNGKFILVTGNLDYQDDHEKNIYDLVLFKPLRFQDLVDQSKKLLSLNF